MAVEANLVDIEDVSRPEEADPTCLVPTERGNAAQACRAIAWLSEKMH